MDKSNIAILTTVANFRLYEITSRLFPMGIRKYVIDGRNGMHGIHSIFYMFNKLKKKNIKWLIMADEDLVFKNSEVVFSIIDKMEKENISVCGVRDGGVIKHRTFNPIPINTFFSIINFKDISKEWSKRNVIKHQYILLNEFKIDESLKESYDIDSLYEPYYCFFLWLKRKGKKFLYLDAKMLNDMISNSILFGGQEFAYHTWHARSYNVNKSHTNRINDVLNTVHIDINPTEVNTDIIQLKDSLFYFKMKIKNIYKRFLKRLNGKN